jgi:arylsulfatase A-like enzyme
MYEHTINVPLVIAGPAIPAGKRLSTQCYLRDLFPTICELAKINVPQIDGRSLMSALHGDKTEIYPFIVGYFQDSQRMIREGDWKLIWYPKISRWQLFNLTDDADELRDLIDSVEQRERIAGLRSNLLSWLREHGDHVAKSD